MAINTDEPRDDTTEPTANPAPPSENGAEQASEATPLDGGHSWIVDETEKCLREGKGGFGIVGGVRTPPTKPLKLP